MKTKRLLAIGLVLLSASYVSAVDLWFDVDAAISEAPVNLMPLVASADGITVDSDVDYNAAGLVLVWHFVTTSGAYSQTLMDPCNTGGEHDWVEQGNGMFTIEIPATDGGNADIVNDTEGYGWFTGSCTGLLPWRGPVIGFRKSSLNDVFVDGTTDLATGADMQSYVESGTTAVVGAAGVSLTALPWNAAWDAEVQSEAADAIGTGTWATAVPWNAAWDAEVQSEAADAIGTGTWATAVPWNAAWDAEVQSEAADALTAYAPATSTAILAMDIDGISFETLLKCQLASLAGKVTVTTGSASRTYTYYEQDSATVLMTITVAVPYGNRTTKGTIVE